MNEIEHSIPEQKRGVQKQFSAARRFITLDDAQLCYATAVSRLLNINRWHERSAMGTTFQIVSRNKNPQRRRARLNDYIRIGTPAPDNADGNGDDWVQVVSLKFLTGKRKEQCLLTLRPCSMPGEEHTAHFFSRVSTSSFLLTRNGRIVTAAYYGRNELPNTDTSGLLETARNVVVAAGAMLGFSGVMWGPFMAGLLSDGSNAPQAAASAASS